MTRETPKMRNWPWDLGVAGFLMSTPLSVELWVSQKDPMLKLPLVDAVLWVLVATLLVTRRVSVRSLAALPKAFVAVAGLTIGTSLALFSGSSSLAACVQRLDVVIVVGLMALGLPPGVLARGVARTLPIITFVFLVVALAQLISPNHRPWMVHSVFEDQYLFGAWTSIVAANVIAKVPERPREWVWRGGLLACIVLTATTILPWVGVMCGTTAAIRDPIQARARVVKWLATVLVLAAVAVFSAPPSHRESIAEAWRLVDVATPEELHARGFEIDALYSRLKLFTLPRSLGELAVATPNVHPPTPIRHDLRRQAVFAPNYVDQRFLEAQAALNAVFGSPIFGWGLGSYQSQVTLNYLTFRKLKTLRPNSQCGWLVEMVQTGIAGVVALLLLLSNVVAITRKSRWTGLPSQRMPLQASVAAAVIVAIAFPLFDTPMMSLLMVLCATAFCTGRPAATQA